VIEQSRATGDEELPVALALLPRVASLLAILVGTLTFSGWLLDVERLRRPLSAFVAMNPATAVGFILVGIALGLSLDAKQSMHAVRPLAMAFGGLVVLLGAAKLAGLAFHWNPNVDEVLFHSQLSVTGQLPNRMAPNTALDFVLVGLALLAVDLRLAGGSFGQIFAVLSGFGALLPLTGYLYGERSFQGLASFIPMAPQTAVTFLAVALGIFFTRPQLPLTQTFSTRDPRGVLARRLAPITVALILALGWLRLQGEQRGYFSANLGTALFAVTLSLFFVIVVAWAATAVGRAARERNAANLALLESKVELEDSLRQTQLIIDHAREIICTVDNAGKLLSVSAAAETILGRTPKELVGTSFSELHSTEDRAQVEAALRQVKTGFQTANIAARCVRRDRTLASVAWSLQSSAHHRRVFCVGREGGAFNAN